MISFRRIFTIVCLFAAALPAQGASPAQVRASHLQHGVSLSSWFAESNNYSIDHLRSYTTFADIAHIHQLGFDHVRIPVDPTIFQCESSWDSCEKIVFLDQVIQKAMAEQLSVILDFHPGTDYTHALLSNEQNVDTCLKLWSRIAAHYGRLNSEKIYLEVLNELGSSDAQAWGKILPRLITAIRKEAPNSTIIVQGAGNSDIWNLVQLPRINDDNLIYNFHYYEPHTFTHQGANWGLDFWRDVKNLPFPADSAAVSAAQEQTPSQAARWEMEQYRLDHWNATHISGDIAFVARWARERNLPLLCDEFGVYRYNTHPQDRARWIQATRQALEQNHISWTMWDYQGGFGLVRKETGKTQDDADVVVALGLKSAPATPKSPYSANSKNKP